VTICTLPGGVSVDVPAADLAGRILIDVAYSPWPTTRAVAWQAAGGSAVSGLHMLVRQAVLQVRVFVSGSPEVALEREAEVLSAMTRVVGLGNLLDVH
jgi:shikimate dehydrogenase